MMDLTSDSLQNIPNTTSNGIIIKTYKKKMDRPIGTIQTKTHFIEDFPQFLNGIIDEEAFKYTIDGINYFAELIHYAELEIFSMKYSGHHKEWKKYKDYLNVEKNRENILNKVLINKGEKVRETRKIIDSDSSLKSFCDEVSNWLKKFLEDENERYYLQKGVLWKLPDEKFKWKWIEIEFTKSLEEYNSNKNIINKDLAPVPTIEPEFGEFVQFEIILSLNEQSYTEYLISLKTNMKSYYPYFNHYVLRRYNDFKFLHQEIQSYIFDNTIDVRLPTLPKPTVIGKKSKSTVSKRTAMFQALLDIIAGDERLNSCDIIKDFLNVRTITNEWKYDKYAKSPVRCI